MCKNSPEHFLKFMSLEHPERFWQIIVSNQLYAAEFQTLNDPMEGVFKRHENDEQVQKILGPKSELRVCALSHEENLHNILMWSHYGHFHQGCCFEVSIDGDQPKPIEYNYDVQSAYHLSNADIYDLLLRKFPMWEYEKEARCITKEKFVKVEIHKIYFGYNCETYESYKDAIEKLGKRYNNIEVIKLEAKELQEKYLQYLENVKQTSKF